MKNNNFLFLLFKNRFMRIKEIWDFIWSNTILSWVATLALSFLIANFVFYPVAGFVLQTNQPIVVVISGSMEHNGKNHDEWWSLKEQEYKKHGIDKETFYEFSFRVGLNKGDLIVLRGKQPSEISVGDVIVFDAGSWLNEPTIHRVVAKTETNESEYVFSTKGDNNNNQLDFEKQIKEEEILGVAFFKIPLLGYIKVILNSILSVRGGLF